MYVAEQLSNKELAQQFYDIVQQFPCASEFTSPTEQRDLIAEFSGTPNFADFYQRHNFVPCVHGMDPQTQMLLTLIFKHGVEKAKPLYASKLAYALAVEKHPPRTEGAIKVFRLEEEGGPSWDNIIRTLDDSLYGEE